MGLKAIVRDGRFVIDQPTDLPEGTELDLVVDDESFSLESEELQSLNMLVAQSLEDAREGKTHPASEILQRLSKRRQR